jgi:uncharacterized Zn-binding protein involved in type VI secretion
MNLIGWVRLGDKAACGGEVAEGVNNCTGHGVPYSFEGALMACRNNCVIAEGFSRSTLPNGRSRVIHGMRTSGGCPLYSTLNDVDGVSNLSGDVLGEKHSLNADGEWMAVKEPPPHEAPYDELPHLVAPLVVGVPYFIETKDGRTFPGRTGTDGLLPRIDTYGEDEYTVYWGDEALSKMEGATP